MQHQQLGRPHQAIGPTCSSGPRRQGRTCTSHVERWCTVGSILVTRVPVIVWPSPSLWLQAGHLALLCSISPGGFWWSTSCEGCHRVKSARGVQSWHDGRGLSTRKHGRLGRHWSPKLPISMSERTADPKLAEAGSRPSATQLRLVVAGLHGHM